MGTSSKKKAPKKAAASVEKKSSSSSSSLTTANSVLALLVVLAAIGYTFLWNQDQDASSVNITEERVLSTDTSMGTNPWEGVSFVIHRNGEPDPCTDTAVSASSTSLRALLQKDTTFDKYQVESLLTKIMHKHLPASSCASPDNSTATAMGLLGFCDMGIDRTPTLLDHDMLVRVSYPPPHNTLPCRWHTREGLRITSFAQLSNLAASAKDEPFHLYAVQAGRPFVFAPKFVGEIFDLSHLELKPTSNPVQLEVLSLSPKVFDILNIFTADEAQNIVDRALNEKSESHKIKRSTTGTSEKAIFQKRTSENGFDTHGKVAITVKKRVFEMLGYDDLDWATKGHDDGLQVLRYNQTTAYTPHFDYFEDKTLKEPYDYDSAHKGGNRFATVLLYMSDLPEAGGGETVFSEAWPPSLPEGDRLSLKQSLEQLRASGDARDAGIEEGSWEEEMIATCRSKLSVKPHAGRAVLFYSQHPNGSLDKMSKHGGCPTLKGEKWAANLWVWNHVRRDYPGQPLREEMKGKVESNTPQQLKGIFRNTGKDPAMNDAKLYFEDSQFWGNLGPEDDDLVVNTYHGHRWTVQIDGKVIKEWNVQPSPKTQVFEL